MTRAGAKARARGGRSLNATGRTSAIKAHAADSSMSQFMDFNVSKGGRAGADQPPCGGSLSTTMSCVYERTNTYSRSGGKPRIICCAAAISP